MSKQLLLIGDSNVRRYFDRIRGVVGEVDFAQARNLSEWSEALLSCQKNYRIVTYSFLTNLIVDSGSQGVTDDDRLDQIDQVLGVVIQAMR